MRHLVWWRTLGVLIAVLSLVGCALEQREAGYDENADFPVPAGLRPNVDFWRDVYANWSRGQVAIHDERYLGVVYEVARLPGSIGESYTEDQRAFVAGRKGFWSARLRLLRDQVARGGRLDREQAALKTRLAEAGAALSGAAERVRSQRGLRERFRRGLEISGRYDAAIRAIFRDRGLPEDLAYLPHVESSFQLHARSSVGASGVWQFMRSTARQYMAVNDSIDERLDPILAAEGAARYLGDAYRRLGYWPLALTAYNHGVGGMKRAQARFGNDIASIVRDYDGRYFGFASRNFYAEFLAARHVARHADRYFPEGLRGEAPLRATRQRLDTPLSVTELARRHGVSAQQLIAYNPAWLDPLRDGRRPVPAGSHLWLPAGGRR